MGLESWALKVGCEKWDPKSGARKVEREKWSGGKWEEKSEVGREKWGREM